MAQHATVYCGKDSVDWTKLADAIALLEKVGRDGTINRVLKRMPATKHASEYIGSISSLPAYRLVQNTTGMFRGQDKRRIRTWRYTLEELVSYMAAFRASRLHDTIYAVLGLASDIQPAPTSRAEQGGVSDTNQMTGIRRTGTTMASGREVKTFDVNYETPVLRVFKEFIDHAISTSKSLDIMCRPWAPTSGVDLNGKPDRIVLPSWISNLSRKPFQLTQQGNMVRYNPDPLVGPSSFRHKSYSASGVEEMECEFIPLEGSDTGHMSVRGFRLGEIGNIWDSGKFGNVPAEWLAAGGWSNDNDPPPDELWRTLVADRNAQGDDPDRWYPMVFQSVVKERGLSYGFETHRLIHESSNAAVVEVFRRVQAVVWNRKLIRMKGNFMLWLAGKPLKRAGIKKEDDKEKKMEENERDKESKDKVSKGEDEEEENKAEGEKREGQRKAVGKMEGGKKEEEKKEEEKKVEEKDEKKDKDEIEEKEEEQVLGLAPDSAQKGDIICILFGCSVPLLLRQREYSKGRTHASGVNMPNAGSQSAAGTSKSRSKSIDRPDNLDKPKTTYTLIGECYVDHMMDGEAIAYFNDQELLDEPFELV
jgi:hypothetical protein